METVETLRRVVLIHLRMKVPSKKAKKYIGKFENGRIRGKRIMAEVEGNHGTYTVSITVKGEFVRTACSCYIGSDGTCHHCEALLFTFKQEPDLFKQLETVESKPDITLSEVHEYLQGHTLAELLGQLKDRGISQKDFAESIGMNPRHLTSIKSCEQRNRYYNELGATKLACLWALEHGLKKDT